MIYQEIRLLPKENSSDDGMNILETGLATGGLVEFYGTSTIIGYLLLDPVFTYIRWYVNSFGRYIFK